MKDKQSHTKAGKLGGLAAAKHQRLKHERCVREYNANPKTCKGCKTKLPYVNRRNIFCNHSCSASHNNKGVRRHGLGKKPCLFCGKITNNPKFCNSFCNEGYRWQELKTRVENGQNTRPRTLKKYLLETREHQCEICRRVKWRKQPILLIMDHKDGNSDNNHPGNLRLICSNCDAQLPTYKAKNTGSGRHSRRKRYKTGLSY